MVVVEGKGERKRRGEAELGKVREQSRNAGEAHGERDLPVSCFPSDVHNERKRQPLRHDLLSGAAAREERPRLLHHTSARNTTRQTDQRWHCTVDNQVPI
jgi:hypothetical protein